MPLLQLHFQITAPPVMQNISCPGKYVPGSSKLFIASLLKSILVMQESKGHHLPFLEPISQGGKLSVYFNEPLFWCQEHNGCLNSTVSCRLWLAEAD